MTVQGRADTTNLPFVTSGKSYVRNGLTFAQDAGRIIALAFATVLSMILTAVAAVVPNVGNTGDGTVTAFALAKGPLAIVGNWVLECVTAVANGGVFKLTDPNGNIVANDLTMTAGAGLATTFITNGMTFIITDAAVDFIVGDSFILPVDAVNKITALDVTAVDGSQIPTGIYMGDEILAATIVAGDVVIYNDLIGGACTVDVEQIVLEGAATLETVLDSGKTVKQELYALGIFAEDTQNIDYFENS